MIFLKVLSSLKQSLTGLCLLRGDLILVTFAQALAALVQFSTVCFVLILSCPCFAKNIGGFAPILWMTSMLGSRPLVSVAVHVLEWYPRVTHGGAECRKRP